MNINQVQSIGWQKYRALLVRLEKWLSARHFYHPEYDAGYGNADRRHALAASGAHRVSSSRAPGVAPDPGIGGHRATHPAADPHSPTSRAKRNGPGRPVPTTAARPLDRRAPHTRERCRTVPRNARTAPVVTRPGVAALLLPDPTPRRHAPLLRHRYWHRPYMSPLRRETRWPHGRVPSARGSRPSTDAPSERSGPCRSHCGTPRSHRHIGVRAGTPRPRGGAPRATAAPAPDRGGPLPAPHRTVPGRPARTHSDRGPASTTAGASWRVETHPPRRPSPDPGMAKSDTAPRELPEGPGRCRERGGQLPLLVTTGPSGRPRRTRS